MKSIVLLIGLLISLSMFGQHPLLEKAVKADTIDTLENIEDLHLESRYFHSFILGQSDKLTEEWLKANTLFVDCNTFDYDTFALKIKYHYNLEIHNDSLWKFIIKEKNHGEKGETFFISKGGNIIVKKYIEYDDGILNYVWWTNDKIFNYIKDDINIITCN